MIPIPVLSKPLWSLRKLAARLQGAWYEPAIGGLWQTETTATPVTTGGQSVGRIADLSGAGYHASQATAGNRPVFGVRYNLLTYTDDLSNSVWVKTFANIQSNAQNAPDGTLTADTITATNTLCGFAYRLDKSTPAGSYLYSSSVKKGLSFSIYFDDGIANGIGITYRGADGQFLFFTTLGNGWVINQNSCTTHPLSVDYWHVSITFTRPQANIGLSFGCLVTINKNELNNYAGYGQTSVGDTLTAWGADLRLVADANKLPLYQRVTTATDYDQGPYPAIRHDATDTLTAALPDLGSGVYSAVGSVYFATPVGMSALHNQPMGTAYNLPTPNTDWYGLALFPSRLSGADERQLEKRFLALAGLAEPDYLVGSPDVNLVGMAQTSRNWSAMTTAGNDIYACVYSGDIYKRINGAGNFIALNETARVWRGMATLNADVYACVYGGDIYKQANASGSFVALGQTSRNWSAMCDAGQDIYACVYGGDIYKQTNGTGNFISLSQTNRAWSGIAAIGADVYACVNNGDIYKQTNGTGNFVALSQTSRLWNGLASNGADIYACVQNGDVYKLTNGAGNFVALGQTSRNWYGLTVLASDLYACVYGGDIYQDQLVTPDILTADDGETLILAQ